MFEVLDVFNHANFQTWVTYESSPLYGTAQTSVNIAYKPRMLQLGVRATF